MLFLQTSCTRIAGSRQFQGKEILLLLQQEAILIAHFRLERKTLSDDTSIGRLERRVEAVSGSASLMLADGVARKDAQLLTLTLGLLKLRMSSTVREVSSLTVLE